MTDGYVDKRKVLDKQAKEVDKGKDSAQTTEAVGNKKLADITAEVAKAKVAEEITEEADERKGDGKKSKKSR